MCSFLYSSYSSFSESSIALTGGYQDHEAERLRRDRRTAAAAGPPPPEMGVAWYILHKDPCC